MPQWFDSYGKCAELCIVEIPGLNATMVRFIFLCPVNPYLTASSQCHNGSIHIKKGIKETCNLHKVSMPQWFDSYIK